MACRGATLQVLTLRIAALRILTLRIAALRIAGLPILTLRLAAPPIRGRRRFPAGPLSLPPALRPGGAVGPAWPAAAPGEAARPRGATRRSARLG